MENQKYFYFSWIWKRYSNIKFKIGFAIFWHSHENYERKFIFSDFSYTAMNNSIKYQFPSCFKAADVTPVYKRGEKITIGLLAFYR